MQVPGIIITKWWVAVQCMYQFLWFYSIAAYEQGSENENGPMALCSLAPFGSTLGKCLWENVNTVGLKGFSKM